MSASEITMSLDLLSLLIIMSYVLRVKVSHWTTDMHIAIVLTEAASGAADEVCGYGTD